MSPHQPLNDAILEATKEQIGKQLRVFQKQWFKEFPWLTLCTTQNRVYCFYCRSCIQDNELQFAKCLEPAFITDGFKNWKKAISKFQSHQLSSCHREAMFKFKRRNTPGIGSQLNDQVKKVQAVRREMFLKQLSTLRMLLKQGLAIRGHHDKDGNLVQLLQLRAEDDPQLKKWIHDNDYLSPEIVNECITIMGNQLLRHLLDEIRTNSNMFAILAAETRDVSNCEQLCICIRWVDQHFDIHEDFIGLVQLDRTDADSICQAIKDVLTRCILPLSQCRGQGYDGASNMMGHLRGVATQLRKEEPTAIHVHCLAHCLNLCLQDAAKINKNVRVCLSLVMEISQLIRYSPKRTFLFNNIKNEVSPDSQGLKPLCPTRWTVRTAAIESVVENYEPLTQAMEEINRTSHDEYGAKAGGILVQLHTFDTYFGFKLFSPCFFRY